MKTLCPLYLLSLLTALSNGIFSQNLVQNCDFEEITECPDGHSQFDKAVDWRTPTGGSSDLCHHCASELVGVPGNLWGNQEAYSGGAYGHIISYYYFVSPQYREYMQAELACPLRAGEAYEVSFFVSCSDNSGFGIDGMSLHFSSEPITQSGNIFLDLGGLPEISNPSGQPIINKNDWLEISGTYIATGGEKYITIGNFLSDESLTIYDFPGTLSNYASYYVSHVSVTPVNLWLDLGQDTTVCPEEVIRVDASLGCHAHYLWNDGDTNAIRVLPQPGLYSVDVSIGCGTVTDNISLNWYTRPGRLIPPDTVVCYGGSVYLDAGTGFACYLWQDGSQDQGQFASEPGIYWVEVEDENGCWYKDSCKVSPLNKPETGLGEDLELCFGDSVLLDAGDPAAYSSYIWQDLTTSPEYLVTMPGIFWVTVKNPCGTHSDTLQVGYKDCEATIWVPNAFTPGNDGLNDTFKVNGLNIKDFRLYIYNRWGQLLYTSSVLSDGWDGTFSGSPCPVDVYVWLIRFSGTSAEDNGFREIKGNVMLIR